MVLFLSAVGFAGLRTATAQDTASNGILAAASFLLLAGIGFLSCWGFALLARFSYPKALLALADGARDDAGKSAAQYRHPCLSGMVSAAGKGCAAWFVYLLPLWLLLGGAGSALGMACLMRPAFAQLEKAGRKDEAEEPEEENLDGGTEA